MTNLTISYTLNEVCGYPGPNLFFHGKSEGFEKLSFVLQDLLQKENHEVCLNDLSFLKLNILNRKIVFRSSLQGNILTKVTDREILTDLSVFYWEKLFIWSVILSRGDASSTVYVEFDNHNLIEECNMIWEC